MLNFIYQYYIDTKLVNHKKDSKITDYFFLISGSKVFFSILMLHVVFPFFIDTMKSSAKLSFYYVYLQFAVSKDHT